MPKPESLMAWRMDIMFFTCHPIPKFDTNTNLGYGLSSPVPASKPKKTNAENLDEPNDEPRVSKNMIFLL